MAPTQLTSKDSFWDTRTGNSHKAPQHYSQHHQHRLMVVTMMIIIITRLISHSASQSCRWWSPTLLWWWSSSSLCQDHSQHHNLLMVITILKMIIIIITLPRPLSASPSGGWSAVRGTRSPQDKIPHSPSPSQHQTVQDPTKNTNTHTLYPQKSTQNILSTTQCKIQRRT